MQLRARRGFNPGKGGFDQGCGDERCENPGTIPEKVDIFINIYIYIYVYIYINPGKGPLFFGYLQGRQARKIAVQPSKNDGWWLPINIWC